MKQHSTEKPENFLWKLYIAMDCFWNLNFLMVGFSVCLFFNRQEVHPQFPVCQPSVFPSPQQKLFFDSDV